MPDVDDGMMQLDEEQLAELDDRLDLRRSQLMPGANRGSDHGTQAELPYGVERVEEIDEICSDIRETVRRGIHVAPHIEARPLVALFAAADSPLPPEFKVDVEELGYELYIAEAVFSATLEHQVGLSSAKFSLEFSDDITDPARGVRVVRLFPGRKDIELFRAEVAGSVGLDATMNLASGAPAPIASASATAKLSVVAGPFSFSFRRAALEVTGEGAAAASWNYRLEDELSARNDFKSIVVLKVAGEARRVDAVATLEVVPYKRRWALFKTVLPRLRKQRRIPIELRR